MGYKPLYMLHVHGYKSLDNKRITFLTVSLNYVHVHVHVGGKPNRGMSKDDTHVPGITIQEVDY